MGVYINRDELMELYANTDELDISNYDVKVAVIRQNILDMPTIDIVTCEECKWWDKDGKRKDGKGWCENVICGLTKPNAFCSYGERRSE